MNLSTISPTWQVTEPGKIRPKNNIEFVTHFGIDAEAVESYRTFEQVAQQHTYSCDLNMQGEYRAEDLEAKWQSRINANSEWSTCNRMQDFASFEEYTDGYKFNVTVGGETRLFITVKEVKQPPDSNMYAEQKLYSLNFHCYDTYVDSDDDRVYCFTEKSGCEMLEEYASQQTAQAIEKLEKENEAYQQRIKELEEDLKTSKDLYKIAKIRTVGHLEKIAALEAEVTRK